MNADVITSTTYPHGTIEGYQAAKHAEKDIA